jgi:uncharacterized protein YegP (UPF0339 family)
MTPIRFQLFRRVTLRGWRWYWRCIAGNNRIIFTSGEGFHNKTDAEDTIETVIEKIGRGNYLIEEV